MYIRYTEAGRRILTAAAKLAARQSDAAVNPVHLLWAIVEDESRAAEMLDERGLNSQRLEHLFPLGTITPDDETRTSTQAARSGQPPAFSEVVKRVLKAACEQAAAFGRDAEVGSEHLLFGLVREQSAVAQVLRSHGLDSSVLEKALVASAGFSDQPIEVDIHIKRAERTQTDRTDVLRTIDAAYNRAREGLRVLEDYTRFSLDDAYLTEKLKNCRHTLARGMAGVVQIELISARDTLEDVGTGIHTRAEMSRQSSTDVVRANCCRVTEALRTLEESGKIVTAEQGPIWKALRYEMYTLEKAILLTQANRSRFEYCRLYVLATESACHHGTGPAIRGALAAGAKAIQLREKEMPVRRFLDYAARVREWTREAGALLFINDRPDLAVLADADGVHVGQDDLTVREARRIVGPDRLVGVSTHTIEQAGQAILDGADYLGVGPVFPTATKEFDQLAGLEFVRQAAESISLPWFAIGGISPANIGEVIAAGAKRVAVSAAICAAEDPHREAASLLAQLEAGVK